MKILFLIRALTVGGAQRQLITLANGLADAGNEISIAVFYAGGELEKTLDARVKIVYVEKGNRWDVLGFVFKLSGLLKATQPDALYSFLESANVLSVMMKLFVPDLKVVWGKRSAYLALDEYGLIARLLFFVERKLARFADYILFNSELAQTLYFEDGFARQKSSVVLNGFDAQKFWIDDVGGTRIRVEFGIEAEQRLIGMVGRIDPIKNHALFLRAVAQIMSVDQSARFVVVGSGEAIYMNELIALAKNLGLQDTLIWVGEREDMAAVYSALDVLVSASHGESFSNVIGEAMLCGTPCVVTDVGASAQVVDRFGKVIPVESDMEMVGAVLELKEEGDVLDGVKIRQHILDNYSVVQLVEKTEAIFAALLED